ncbi:dual specificity phosphatase 1, partial [Columba livia]
AALRSGGTPAPPTLTALSSSPSSLLPSAGAAMVNLRVCALECEALRALLQERPAQCLVLDCRSFFSFNAAHIRGSSPPSLFPPAGGYEAFSSACSELCTKPAAPAGLSLPLSASSAPGSAESGCSSCGTPLYDQGGPVEILPFLYLGSAYHASRKDMLDALGITALINVSANCPNHFEGHYQYKSIPVEDNHKADISSWFNEAIDFIDSVKNDGGRVFVHCQAGISRSATICLAYLMRTNRVKLDEAFEFVKQRRSIISPNFSFMGQLLQFESQVLAPNCSAEAGSPAMSVLDRGASTTTVFNFPVSIPVHTSSSALSYLQSPITTSPSC